MKHTQALVQVKNGFIMEEQALYPQNDGLANAPNGSFHNSYSDSNSSLCESRSYENKVDINDYTALQYAIIKKDIPSLYCLLKQEGLDLNSGSCYDETALMMSLTQEHKYSIIMHFIEAASDINIVDCKGRTALHNAISDQNVDITHELIKRGTDINARTCYGDTPLFEAIDTGNLEIFCMLLYYGADVTIINEDSLTALTRAMQKKNTEMAQLLIPYYDNFDYTDKYNNSPLQLAVQCNRILAFELLELGADVNGINDSGYCVLDFILMKNDVELFKKVWPKFDYQILLKIKEPLLITYLHCMLNLSTSEWLEGFYLILACPIALDLIQHCIDFYSRYEDCGFSRFLTQAYHKRKLSLNHMTNIISVCLSLGVNVKVWDLRTIFDLLGYQENFEILLYAADNFAEYCCRNHKFYPLFPVILGMEDFNIKTVIQIIESCSGGCFSGYFLAFNMEHKQIFDCLGFCSMSYSTKQNLSCLTRCQSKLEKIKRIPEFPTLVELSRNQAHKFIRQTYNIKKPYHFQDAVKRLPVPQYIKDVIRFKIPIYE